MGYGGAASYVEACLFKHADQFVDVLPKETLEESRVYSLIAALDRFDDKQAIRLQDLQDLLRDPIDVEGVIERICVDDVH